MATISKRKGGWFVQIRRKGFEPQYKTLPTRAEAEQWSREREALIDRGDQVPCQRDLRRLTLGDLIRRYLIEVTPKKLSADTERLRLNKMLRHPMCAVTLPDLSKGVLAAYRDKRVAEVKPGTVARELSLLHNVIDVAQREWDFQFASNPVAQIRKVPVRNSRNRRLMPGEFERLSEALGQCRNRFIGPAVILAIETAMRRSEIINLCWSDVSIYNRTALIRHTKTGYSRIIPLNHRSLELIGSLPKISERVIPISIMALKLSWNRARLRADLSDLNFHDLRHEAISRFAEIGLSTVELAAISGHRDLRMLLRYTHIQPATLARKLAGLCWERDVKILPIT